MKFKESEDMITHIQGKLVEKTPTHVIVDCNGTGYFINISLHTFSQITDQESIKVLTHLQVKEDSHTLYGFMSSAEREIFRLLISVSGIGANTARTMLSSLTPIQIREGIAIGDVPLIQSVKGIGLKTAIFKFILLGAVLMLANNVLIAFIIHAIKRYTFYFDWILFATVIVVFNELSKKIRHEN